MRNYWEEIKRFYEYVWEFYNLESGEMAVTNVEE